METQILNSMSFLAWKYLAIIAALLVAFVYPGDLPRSKSQGGL